MIGELIKALADNIDAVFIFPIVTILVCLLVRRLGFVSWTLREMAYVAVSLSLSAGYALALSIAPNPLMVIAMISPQVYILLTMACVAIVSKLKNPTYRMPSFWRVVLVAALGHGWTHLLFAALTHS